MARSSRLSIETSEVAVCSSPQIFRARVIQTETTVLRRTTSKNANWQLDAILYLCHFDFMYTAEVEWIVTSARRYCNRSCLLARSFVNIRAGTDRDWRRKPCRQCQAAGCAVFSRPYSSPRNSPRRISIMADHLMIPKWRPGPVYAVITIYDSAERRVDAWRHVCLQGESKKVDPLRLSTIFLLRLSLFA